MLINDTDFNKLVIAKVKGKVVAVTTLKLSTKLTRDQWIEFDSPEDPNSAYIEISAAYPESQLNRAWRQVGQVGSVGRAVMDHAIRYLQDKGYSAIYYCFGKQQSYDFLKALWI